MGFDFIRKIIKPVSSKLYIPIYNRFIATEYQVENIINKLKQNRINPIVDYAIEKSGANAGLVVEKVKKQVALYPNEIHALKLSVLDLQNQNECFKNCSLIHENSPNTQLLVDAEQDELQPAINQISDKLILTYNHKKPIFFKTYQMYRTDSLDRLNFDLYYFHKMGVYHGIKLVRGAYYHQDSKKPGILHTNKKSTDEDYNHAISIILQNARINQNIQTIIATHNKHSIEFFLSNFQNNKNPVGFEKSFYSATLMGFQPKYPIYPQTPFQHLMYLPYGPIFDTLPYLSRRLIENKEMIKNIN